MSTLETNLIQPSTGTTLTLGASGDTITIPSGATITNSGTATGFTGVIAAKIETISPTTPDVTTTSTTYAEVASGLRITHALSNSSNKLIFMFSSTDMYAGCNGQVAIASTADVTTSVIGNQIMLVKNNAYGGTSNVEVDTMMGMAEYAPGSTSSVTYTPVFARIGGAGTFYINNTVTSARMTFTLMEIA